MTVTQHASLLAAPPVDSQTNTSAVWGGRGGSPPTVNMLEYCGVDGSASGRVTVLLYISSGAPQVPPGCPPPRVPPRLLQVTSLMKHQHTVVTSLSKRRAWESSVMVQGVSVSGWFPRRGGGGSGVSPSMLQLLSLGVVETSGCDARRSSTSSKLYE